MKLHLKNIADIQIGFSFRSQVNNIPSGKFYVVQQKDLLEDTLSLNTSSLFRANISGARSIDKYCLQENDLVFRSRGSKPLTVMAGGISENTVLASSLMRVRVTGEEVLPQYLLWYLNSDEALTYFAKNARGTSIKHIDTKSLGELEIPILPLDRQRVIADMAYLTKREYMLSSRLAEKKHLLRLIQINELASKGV